MNISFEIHPGHIIAFEESTFASAKGEWELCVNHKSETASASSVKILVDTFQN